MELPEIKAHLRGYEKLEIGEARALPLSMYTSAALYELELEALFRRDWICVGRTEQVARVGDYFTVEIAGEPIVIVRSHDEKLRALSAVCRHRYMSVIRGSGNTRRLECPYHRWSYGLDGELRGAPLMKRPTDADGTACRLPEFALDTWLGFVFVSLDAQPVPLARALTGAADILAPYDFERWRIAVTYDEIWQGNWKLGLETALEGYHLDGLHRNTIAGMMPSRGVRREAASEHWNAFRIEIDFDDPLGAPLRPIAQAMGGLDAVASPTVTIYPNLSISCSPGQCMWLTFLPVSVDRTRALGALLVCPEEFERVEASADYRARAKATVDLLNEEDASAMVDLQRNVRSRHASPGLLCEKEACLLDFYRHLGARLGVPQVPATR